MQNHLCRRAAGAGVVAAALTLHAGEPKGTNAPSGKVLLSGPLGQVVTLETNDVPAKLLPPARLGVGSQIPAPTRGTEIPEPVLQRLREAREKQREFQWFPSAPPRLEPYLAAQDEFGNTAIRPGPLLRSTPLDVAVQQGKYWLSEVGLRYSLAQTLTFVGMSDVMQGENALGFYTFDFAGKWAVFSTADSGTARWISTQIEAKTGLGSAGDTQSPQRNLGAITNPSGIWSSVNGFRIPELAWQQSFLHGEFVALAGIVSQGNYLDVNSYANSGRGQFLNSALINSMVMPLPNYNPGVNLQWQPVEDWYFMVGASAGDVAPTAAPWAWSEFDWDVWATLFEFGYTPDDVLGLGPGVYRVQPFLARAGGPIQAGLCFNLQQQLGKEAPFGWFGRFGFGGSQVTAGASAQIGTGFVMKGPLQFLGLAPSREHDAAGLGFAWSQPSATAETVMHENEYVLEAGYVLQLTPTAKLQPDLQIVWNPAFNPESGPAVVFQLQLDLAW